MAKTFDLFLRDFGIGHLRLQSSLWGLDEQRAHLKLSVARTYLISTVCCLKIQTEVFAENRRRELRRSPLRPYADLIHAWGLRLFVVRRFCPALASELLVETWELEGLLYGWRIFAAVHKHTRVPLTQVAPDPDSETEQEALERTYWA